MNQEEKQNPSIGCTVYDCEHCNCNEDVCQLDKIKVCHCKNTEEKEATMCDSYQKKVD